MLQFQVTIMIVNKNSPVLLLRVNNPKTLSYSLLNFFNSRYGIVNSPL